MKDTTSGATRSACHSFDTPVPSFSPGSCRWCCCCRSCCRQVEELLQMMRSVFQEMAATIRREAAEAVSAAVSSPDSDVTGAQGANEPAGASKAKGTPATPKAGKDQNKANQQGSSQGSPQQGPKPVQSKFRGTALLYIGSFHSTDSRDRDAALAAPTLTAAVLNIAALESASNLASTCRSCGSTKTNGSG